MLLAFRESTGRAALPLLNRSVVTQRNSGSPYRVREDSRKNANGGTRRIALTRELSARLIASVINILKPSKIGAPFK